MSMGADGVGTRQRGDCDAEQSDGGGDSHVSPLLAGGGQQPLPHL